MSDEQVEYEILVFYKATVVPPLTRQSVGQAGAETLPLGGDIQKYLQNGTLTTPGIRKDQRVNKIQQVHVGQVEFL